MGYFNPLFYLSPSEKPLSIPFMGYLLKCIQTLQYRYFQFPLWDTQKIFFWTPFIFNFQFPLWDTGEAISHPTPHYLSFQFPLWDTSPLLFNHDLNFFRLSIPFMGYEIEKQIPTYYTKPFFQFPLWDTY